MKAFFKLLTNVFNKTSTVVDESTDIAVKTISVVEDGVDLTKGYMVGMKAEEFYGEERHLKDVDVQEVQDFYNSLYVKKH